MKHKQYQHRLYTDHMTIDEGMFIPINKFTFSYMHHLLQEENTSSQSLTLSFGYYHKPTAEQCTIFGLTLIAEGPCCGWWIYKCSKSINHSVDVIPEPIPVQGIDYLNLPFDNNIWHSKEIWDTMDIQEIHGIRLIASHRGNQEVYTALTTYANNRHTPVLELLDTTDINWTNVPLNDPRLGKPFLDKLDMLELDAIWSAIIHKCTDVNDPDLAYISSYIKTRIAEKRLDNQTYLNPLT